MASIIQGPVAPFSNVPIRADYYQPRFFEISAITLGQTTTVTTSTDHDYVVGQQVRLIIPPGYGCRQLNEASAYVIEIPADDQVVLDLDSSQNVDAFIAAGLDNTAKILAIGNINSGVTNSNGRTGNGTYIPGSFINISP